MSQCKIGLVIHCARSITPAAGVVHKLSALLCAMVYPLLPYLSYETRGFMSNLW